MSKISIIIPILNEAATIRKLLLHLTTVCNDIQNIQEIIIADGGSIDNSIQLIEQFAFDSPIPIQSITSPQGRAVQMNRGASIAQGTILYFLHADSMPPHNYDQSIIHQVSIGNVAGCFRMRFDDNHWWLRFLGWLTKFYSKRCRGGDQSLFISQQLFEKIGRYDESFIVYEDNELVDRLFAINTFVIIPKNVITSARKYREIGVWRLQFHFFNIHMRRWLGASPEELYRYYKEKVK